MTSKDINGKEESPDLKLVQVTVNDMAVTADEEQYATIPDMTGWWSHKWCSFGSRAAWVACSGSDITPLDNQTNSPN